VQASISQPHGLAVDAPGGLLIADSFGERVLRLAPDGTISTVAGNTYPGVGAFLGDGGPAADASLSSPEGVAVGPDGSIYITDFGNRRLRRIDRSGIITTIAGGAGMHASLGDGGPALRARLYDPGQPAVDRAGNVYVADPLSNRVRRVSTDGIIRTIAGTGEAGFSGDGGPALSAALDYPFSVAVDAAGSLFIADVGNVRIRKIDAAGVISTVAGSGLSGYSGDGGPATQAQLYGPYGLALDTRGNLLIADTGNNRVRQVFAVAAPVPLPGDLDGDGRVTAADAVLALRAAVGLLAPTSLQLAAGDLDSDGRIDLADAAGILRLAVGLVSR
jgi:sugar lactone lactonase YvrE